jgi:hypothetical protein
MRRKEIRKNRKNDTTVTKRTIRSRSGETLRRLTSLVVLISVFYGNSKQEKKRGGVGASSFSERQ